MATPKAKTEVKKKSAMTGKAGAKALGKPKAKAAAK